MNRCAVCLFGLVALLAVPLAAAAGEPVPDWVAESRQAASALAGELSGALGSAMDEGGTLKAIGVCREQAPAIAESVSGPGWTVGRTALKIRNPDNRPDAWEKRMLEEFQRRIDDGEPAAEVEVFAIHDDGRTRRGRWMRAIGTQPMCLACHGPAIDEATAAAIDEHYPEDQARGFRAGELRGAFTVEIELSGN